MGFNKVDKRHRRYGIEDPEILQRAARMLADDIILRGTARELDLRYATLRTYKLMGLLPSVDEGLRAAASVELDAAPARTDAGTVRTYALGPERRNRREVQVP